MGTSLLIQLFSEILISISLRNHEIPKATNINVYIN